MKLKELVANSLPRVRGKTKKSPSAAKSGDPSHGSPAQSSSLPLSSTSGHVPPQHFLLASPASAVMAAATFTTSGEDIATSQLGFGHKFEQMDTNSLSTFFPAGVHRQKMLNEEMQTSGLTWHGNALYKGMHSDGSLDTATEKIFSKEVVSSKIPRRQNGLPYGGMTSSHSAEGISAHHLLMMSRSGYDARMAVSEYGGSCSSQMSVISESAMEAYSSALKQRQYQHPHQQQQQHLSNFNAHYHQHSHQHYHHYHHHHHLHPTRGMPLAQKSPPGQRPQINMLVGGVSNVRDIPPYALTHAAAPSTQNTESELPHKQTKDRGVKRQELGFFRKSFASLKSMRKKRSGLKSNNTLVSPPHVKTGCVAPLTKANLAASEHLRCSVCPYPDKGGITSNAVISCSYDGTTAETKPSKPKRKVFRGLSKSKSKKSPAGKENNGESGYINSCLTDTDAHSMIVAVGQPIIEPTLPSFYPTWDRSRQRECSVDSFSSSRFCSSSREGSCIRELDSTGLDSASLSGYESDLPPGAKVHRPRSRIRTNPWLPSPQPSLGVIGGCRRVEGGDKRSDDAGDLRESQEDMALWEDPEKLLICGLSPSRAIGRSASFEHRRPATLKSLTSSYHPGCENFAYMNHGAVQSGTKEAIGTGNRKHNATHPDSLKQNQRPLTPNVDPDSLITMSLDRPLKTKSPGTPKKPSWWNFSRRSSKKIMNVKVSPCSKTPNSMSPASLEPNLDLTVSIAANTYSNSCSPLATNTSSLTKISKPGGGDHSVLVSELPDKQTLNDLNMNTAPSVVTRRPNSIVSPNTEFVLLAGHLEQLAHNISFEYEDQTNPCLEKTNNNTSLINTEEESAQNLTMNEGDTIIFSKPLVNNGFPVSSGMKSNPKVSNEGENVNLQSPESPFSSTSGCSVASSCKKSSDPGNTAHSPDSGVGGLESTDGEDTLPSSHPVQARGNRQSDQSTTSSTHLESSLDEPGLHDICPNHEHTFPCFSCHNRRLNAIHSEPKLGSANKRNSLSSGHDDDSSATISESDVDNTHYLEGSLPKGSCPRTSPLSLSNTDLSGNSQNKSPTTVGSQKVNSQHVSSHRPGIIMGSRVSIREQSSREDMQLSISPLQIKDASYHDSAAHRTVASKESALIARQHGGHFKLSSQLGFTTSDNNILNIRPERKLPTNIAPSESLESSTENLHPGAGRMVRTCHLDAAMILEANLRRVKAPSTEGIYFEQNLSEENKQRVLNNSRSCAMTDDAEDKRNLTPTEMASMSEETSLMDFSINNVGEGDRSPNASFDMSDACVQTEFEDFPRWDELDALETLEDSAIDPAENTRRWLLTGNMQGSADTGYASQTRESQILMEDVTFHHFGNLTSDTMHQWNSKTENGSSGHSSDGKTPRNSGCFDIDVDFTRDDGNSSAVLCSSVEDGPFLYMPVPVTQFSSNNPNFIIATPTLANDIKQMKPTVSAKPCRSISPSTVDQMFSNIEQQFQEIFQQRCGLNSASGASPNRKRFSHSSDSTVESVGSQDSSYSGGVPVGELLDVATRLPQADTETWSEAMSESDHFARDPQHHHYTNVPFSNDCGKEIVSTRSRKLTSSGVAKKLTVAQNHCSRGNVVDVSATNKVKESPSDSFQNSYDKREILSFPKSERADYLEFLRDAPLARTYPKKPLFLVPGVGTVDLSCPETVNMFSQEPFESPRHQFEGLSKEVGECVSSSPVTHFGNKSKVKPTNKRNLSDVARSENISRINSCTESGQPVPVPNSSHSSKIAAKSKVRSDIKYVNADFENKSYQCLGVSRKEKQTENKSVEDVTVSTQDDLQERSCPEVTPNDQLSDLDASTRALAERVLELKREKDDVYRKLQVAQLDVFARRGKLMEKHRHAHSGRKDVLLSTLRELRDKLEDQKSLLQSKEKSSSKKKPAGNRY